MVDRKSIRRQIYWLAATLLVFLLAFLTSQIFLNPSSVGNPRFISNFNLWAAVWAINFLIVLALTFFLLRNVIKLFFEYRHERLGSKIKLKLVLVLAMLSLLPSALLFFIAYGLINRTLTQWFNAPGEQMLTASESIAQSYYEALTAKNQVLLERVRDSLERKDRDPLALLRETLAAGSFNYVYWRDGERSFDAGYFNPSIDPELWRNALSSRVASLVRYNDRLEPTTEGLITVLPLRQGVIAAVSTVPKSVTFRVAQVREAAELSSQTSGNLQALKKNYFVLLGLTTVIVMVGFTWFGLYTARTLTVPIEALAEGSRAVAAGDLAHRVHAPATDELAVLIGSFNEMTAQLEANRREIENAAQSLREANVELEKRRNLTEAILQNIGTGVLSLDESFCIETANQAAGKMFSRDARQLSGKTLDALLPEEERRKLEALLRRTRLLGTCRRDFTLSPHLSPRHVAVTADCYLDPGTGKMGYLVVLDDLTELIQGQKLAAWQEVARRLAHEIKNPLTPIQLTAERLLKKFRRLRQEEPSASWGEAGTSFDEVVEDSARIIRQETRVLKDMVDEFSRFARLPLSRPELVNIHTIIDETLDHYSGRFSELRIHRTYGDGIPDTALDREQMKRVFVNLIDNALEAMEGVAGEKMMEIRTALSADRDTLLVEVCDSGPGITSEDYQKLFLPYFSTKKRGTGLGLTIVRQIISEHHGDIRATPNAPRGARFVIELPVSAVGESSQSVRSS